MDKEKSDVLVHVSQNLRRLRLESNMTQQTLADASGISRRMIAAVENGEANVSLASLDRLAIALKTDFSAMVRAPTAEPKYVNEVMWRGQERTDVAVLLGSAPATKEAQMWLWSISPGQSYQAEPDPAGWNETIYVMQGCLRLVLENEEFFIKAGEFKIFPSDQTYAYINASNEITRFIRNVTI